MNKDANKTGHNLAVCEASIAMHRGNAEAGQISS